MESNNLLLFTFGVIFLALGVFSPIINAEFNQDVTTYDTDVLIDTIQEDTSSTNAIQVLSSVFFWVFGLPFWLNIFISMMRVIFWIIVYDKIRGI